jgi:hypothetical protein
MNAVERAAPYRPPPLPLTSTRCYEIAVTDAPTSPVVSKPPPAAIVRGLNRILPHVAGGAFGKLFPAWMAVLEFDGRRSGKHYTVCAGVYDVDGTLRVFTEHVWRLNFTNGAPVTMVRRGETKRGTGTLVDDVTQVGTAMQRVLQTLKPRQIGLEVAKGHTPNASELGVLRGMIVLDLE